MCRKVPRDHRASALLALLAFPSAGHASIWDWIWTMSGPQMVGVVFHCELDWEHKDPENYKAHECRIIDYRVLGGAQTRKERRTWLTLDTNGYTSTGKNSEGFEFGAFETLHARDRADGRIPLVYIQ